MYQVIEFYQQNLQLARESGQRREELSALASLGRAYDALKEVDKAVEFYELALAIAREVGDGRAERDMLKRLNEALNPQAKKSKSEPKTKTPRKPKAKKSKAVPSTKAAKKVSKKSPTRTAAPAKKQQSVSPASRKTDLKES